MGRPVIHWEINSKNAKKLHGFYAKAFEWNVDELDADYAWVDTKTDEGIDGGIAQVDDEDPVGITIYVQVDDIEAALAKIEKLGGTIIVPPTEMPEGNLLAVFADPEGNHVGLVQD